MNTPQKAISIRTKVSIIVLINILILAVLIYTVSAAVISKNYLAIEKADMVENIQRANDAIGNTISQLSTKENDWSSWNDTYNFIQHKNAAYIDSNLQDNALSFLKINAIVFVNTKGDIVYNKVVDLNTGNAVSSESLLAYLASHKDLLTYATTSSAVSGIVLLPEGPLLISSRPILTSEGLGPIQGSLIFGKFLDTNLVSSIETMTHLSITLYPVDSASLPSDVALARANLLAGNTYFVNPLSPDIISGYTIVSNLYGNPVAILKIATPRELYNQATSTISLFVEIATGLIILFGGILIFLLERFITSRLLTLGAEVEKVSEQEDLSLRVEEGPQDEIGKLATTINTMLVAVASSKRLEKEVQERTVELEEAKSGLEKSVKERTSELEEIKSNLKETVKERTFELDAKLAEANETNKLMIGRELKMIELKNEIKMLKGEESSVNTNPSHD